MIIAVVVVVVVVEYVVHVGYHHHHYHKLNWGQDASQSSFKLNLQILLFCEQPKPVNISSHYQYLLIINQCTYVCIFLKQQGVGGSVLGVY